MKIKGLHIQIETRLCFRLGKSTELCKIYVVKLKSDSFFYKRILSHTFSLSTEKLYRPNIKLYLITVQQHLLNSIC